MNRHARVSKRRDAARCFRKRGAGAHRSASICRRSRAQVSGPGRTVAAQRRRRRTLRAERVRAHRRRQHGDGDRQAPRDGAGHVHRPRDAGRRRARRRLGAGARRRRAGRREALQQPLSGDRRRAPAAAPRSRNSYEQLRKAGAAARAMLVAAAARHLERAGGRDQRRRTASSRTRAASKATFGELADEAAAMPVPADVKLKDPKQFSCIGKHVPRKDSAREDQRHREVHAGHEAARHADRGRRASRRASARKVKSFDAAKAKAVRGVVDVVQIPSGVAVLATNFWSAKQGRDALTVQWDETGASEARLGRADGAVQGARSEAGHRRAQATATSRRRSRARRRRSRRRSSFPISRTRRWSR